MKRSQVNSILADAREFMARFSVALPPFANLSPDEMLGRRDELRPIFNAGLGWDITDYGLGRFDEMGLFLFTARNGRIEELTTGGMCYAEKIMISRQNQISPMHRHIVKTEDIINRGGAGLAIKMYSSAKDGSLDPDAPVPVERDGIMHHLSAGQTIVLQPGESVTLRPGNWHEFWGEGGDVLIGEVSTVNDDFTDNVFHQPIDRFGEVYEDCKPDRLLVSDYESWLA